MASNLSIVIIGAEEFAAVCDKAPGFANKQFGNAIARTAYSVENRAKGYAPIHYGALRNSIHTEGPTITPSNIIARVGTNLNYAKYQEDGTGIYGPTGSPIRPKNKKMLAWKQGGQWVFAKEVRGTKGKKYMARARADAKPLATEFLGEALSTIVQYLAKG